jgi:RNA polymerase sigma-70 factor (ECF subfamily)
MEETEDKEIITKVLAGDINLYRHIVEKYKDKIFNYVNYTYAKDSDAAEDLVQETFIRAFDNLKKFDLERPFSPWLFKIATNIALTYVGKRKSISLDILPEVQDKVDITEKIHNKTMRELLVKKIETLPSNYQEVINLHYWQEMKYEEIAGILSVPIGTVRTWLYRAKAMLKESLDGQV